MDRSPFLLKKVADDDLSICDVMLGKDIKLTKLGIWGCTCGTKIDDDAFHCVLAYTDHRYQNSFSKQNFWYGSIPEKGKKQKQNAVQFPDLGTLLRVNVWYSMNLTLKIQLTKGVNRTRLCSATFCKIIIVILNFLKNIIF